MKNDCKTLKTRVLSLAVALALTACAAAHAADKTNTPGMSDTQKRYDQALTKIGKPGEWKDPDKVLPEVHYDGLPVGEVVLSLLDRFDHQFDVLMPTQWEGNNVTGTIDGSKPIERQDWPSIGVNLRLKNVTASEVFNAMNLFFEINGITLRWELMMNGHRPTALLRVVGLAAPKLQEEPKRAIFYVGELMGDEKSGGMTMKQILGTLAEVSFADYKREVNIQCHEGAQMLIVKGTQGEVDLVRETIEALKQKAVVQYQRKEWDRLLKRQSQAAESKPGPAEPKNP
jgi:hypothetical protein